MWAQNRNYYAIKTFIKAPKMGIQGELKTILACKYTQVSEKGQKALEELKHSEDIVIANTDKGDAVVILDAKDYIKESERQLNDTEHYKHLEHDATIGNKTTVNKVVARFKTKKLISSNVSDRLKVESPRTPSF